MTALQPGAKVVAKHPKYRGAWWGTIVTIDGENAGVRFDLDTGTPYYWLPIAILHAPVMPAEYVDDGVGEYYWRKDQEIQAERLAFHHDPANKGKTHWPETYLD
jgi:hypothetical protein